MPQLPTPNAGARIQVIARAVFYVLTLTAAVLAVAASSVGGRSGGLLMSLSWYFIVAGVVAFLLMLVFNVMFKEDAPSTRAGSPRDDAP
ncbi:MAG: hypothetical protein KA795_04860 [Burkholderiaceae bacterium]|nr:hypothetical protein [Burkholderiaceae bacterium]